MLCILSTREHGRIIKNAVGPDQPPRLRTPNASIIVQFHHLIRRDYTAHICQNIWHSME